LFIERARLGPDAPPDGYPFNLPAVRHLETIPFDQVTILVGDNGTGKSTIVEALAVDAGFNPEGGSRNLQFDTFSTHSPLFKHLEVIYGSLPQWGWFLRAETFYGMATYIETDDPVYGVRGMFPEFHRESHGESFIDLALSRFSGKGLYVLDEPESALSLQGQLKLLSIMHDGCFEGSQFIVATHSPILMAFPGATIVELDEDGAHVRQYDEVLAVQLWRRFLDDPPSLLRYLFEVDSEAQD
jgi:predicted ATPase